MFNDSFDDYDPDHGYDNDYDILEDGGFDDENYDNDMLDDGLDDFDDSDDVSFDDEDFLSNEEIAIAGSLDGESDARNGEPQYSQYGSSIELENLTQEQKDIYEEAYHSSFNAN